MEVEGAFDTGRYLNVIECFVAAGSLLIFTCTKIHSAGKCPLEGACELRGFGLGGRDGWEEVSCPACALSLPFCPLDFLLWKKGNCLSSNEQLGWMDGWVAGWWLEGHETPSEWKEKEAERVEGAELERSVAKKKRSKWWWRDWEGSFMACMLLCLKGVTQSNGWTFLIMCRELLFPGWPLHLAAEWRNYLEAKVWAKCILLSLSPA